MSRTKHSVEVTFTQQRTVTLNNIWAESESEAEDKASDIVSQWDNVVDVEMAVATEDT